jgi:hypothetical protein
MRIACFFFLASFLAACSNGGGSTDAGADSGDGGPPGSSCSTDNDCPSIGDHCYYVIDGGCSLQNLKGTCMAFSPPANCTANVACGCDGTTITVCAPAGYVDRSSNHAGACPVIDSGVTDGSADASADASGE